MTQWEYDKVDLSSLSTKISNLDLLNDAGKEGWELVAVTVNNFAVMKRKVSPVPSARSGGARVHAGEVVVPPKPIARGMG